jgi:hypothetical protein
LGCFAFSKGFPPHVNTKQKPKQNPILFKGGITAMKFKRKIAAVLAFIMAFGAIAAFGNFNVEAQVHRGVTAPVARGTGFQGTLMSDVTLGTNDFGTAPSIWLPTNGIDILIPYSELNLGEVLTIQLTHGATWGFNNVVNDARVLRPMNGANPITPTNFGFRQVANSAAFPQRDNMGGGENEIDLDLLVTVGEGVAVLAGFGNLTLAQRTEILNFLNNAVFTDAVGTAAQTGVGAMNEAITALWAPEVSNTVDSALGEAVGVINNQSTNTVDATAVAAYLQTHRVALQSNITNPAVLLATLIGNPPDFTASASAWYEVTPAQWAVFAQALITWMGTPGGMAVIMGAAIAAGDITPHLTVDEIDEPAGPLYGNTHVTEDNFRAWFNTNRLALGTFTGGTGPSGDFTAGGDALTTTGQTPNLLYSGIVNAAGTHWSELPYIITNAGATGNTIQIQLPTVAQLGGLTHNTAYIRIPVIAVVPEGQTTIQANFAGGGWDGSNLNNWVNLVTSGAAPAGGVFRVELGSTALAGLTERDVVVQPRISIHEQNVGNFLAGNVNDPLRGFYLSLPGHYVWANATARGWATHNTAAFYNQGTDNNANNAGMQGVGLELVNFGVTPWGTLGAQWTGGNAIQPANRPFAMYNTGNVLRPTGTAAAFGGIWDSHMDAISAIVRNAYPAGWDGHLTGAEFWLHHNAVVANGVITNLDSFFGASHPVRNTNYAFLSHNGSQINVVLGDTGAGAGIGSRILNFTNLAIGHHNVNAPVFGNVDVTIGNNILGQNQIGTLGANTNIPAAQVISSSPANPLVLRTGVFAPYGLTFERAAAPAGDVTEIIAGRTYTAGAWQRQANAATNTVAMNVQEFAGRTAQVNLTDIVSGSGFGVREYTFGATDSEGNLLDDVKIAAVTFNTTGTGGNGRGITTTTFYNVMGTGNPARQWNIVGQGPGANANFHGQANAAWSPDPTVSFSLDGHQVAVQNLRANVLGWDNANRPFQSDRIQVQATFFLSVDPNFEGPIYISVNDDRNVDMQWRTDFITNDGILHVANVTRLVDVAVTHTTVNVGHLSHQVGNIVISENAAGALRQGGYIEIGLGEMAHNVSPWSSIGFNAVTMANVNIEGHANPNMRTRVNVSTQPDGVIRMNVIGASVGTPSTITLSGLTVQTPQTGLIGSWDLHLRGSAIMDNDTWTINRRAQQTLLGNPLLSTNETGNRRYGFTRGLVAENYFVVTDVTPGIVTIGAHSVARFEQNSPHVVIAGQNRTMMNVNYVEQPVLNIDGRNFIPVRGLTQVFGISAPAWDGVAHTVTFTFGGRTIVFTVGSTTYTVNGESFTMIDAEAAPRNVGGTVYISLASLAHAVGVPVSYVNVAGGNNVIYFNNAGVGTLVPSPDFGAVAAEAEENGEDAE